MGSLAPVGFRSPVTQNWSVNSLPLSVRSLNTLKEAWLTNLERKPLAFSALLFPIIKIHPTDDSINGYKKVLLMHPIWHLDYGGLAPLDTIMTE